MSEYKFPDELDDENDKDHEEHEESVDSIEIDIEDDTPAQDRNKHPLRS